MAEQQTNGNWQERYHNALLGVFGNPQLCLDHGQGCVVVDNDGKEYHRFWASYIKNPTLSTRFESGVPSTYPVHELSIAQVSKVV